MSNAQFKWNNKAFYELRRSPAVIKELESRGRRIMNAANETLEERRGYRMSSFQGRKVRQGRWFVQVYASSNHAKHSDAKHNTLIRVLNETQNPSPPAVRAED